MEMTFNEWEEKYKPIENPYGYGFLFEDYDKDLEILNAHLASDPDTVWTLLGCDGGESIISGMWRVNRVGYYITEIPCDTDDTISIIE
jgi:hypothetical protein